MQHVGAHPSQSIQLSSHVLAAMRHCTEKDWHVKINGPNVLPQACQMSTAQSPLLQHSGAACPCLPTSSLSWPAGKGENCKGNRTSPFPVPMCCPRNTMLGHKQLAKPGCSTSMHHQKQELIQGTTKQGKCCTGRRHCHPMGPSVHTQRQSSAHKEQHRLPVTAWHHHTRQRMGSSLASHWAEASGVVTSPYVSPESCFPAHHLHCLFRPYTL